MTKPNPIMHATRPIIVGTGFKAKKFWTQKNRPPCRSTAGEVLQRLCKTELSTKTLEHHRIRGLEFRKVFSRLRTTTVNCRQLDPLWAGTVIRILTFVKLDFRNIYKSVEAQLTKDIIVHNELQ
jgi:hypothetical protein